CGANTPGAVSGIGMSEQSQMKGGLERVATDKCPQPVQPGFALRGAENEPLQFRAQFTSCASQALGQNPLRRFAEINVPAAQPRDQLLVALTREIDFRRARRVVLTQQIEP